MNYANEASLYCRRLESITFSPHKMLKMQTMCSSISAGKEQSLTVPRVLLWPTSFFHRGVNCRMQCSRLRAGCRLRLPFIASLHCRRLETITFSPHKMLKMQTMCSSNFERERTKPYCSTCVAVADFLRSQRCCLQNVVQPTEGQLQALAPFYSLAPLYKLAKARQNSPVGIRRILSK